MAKADLAQTSAKLYELLTPLTPEERNRVIQATSLLFGDEAQPTVTSFNPPVATTHGPQPRLPSNSVQGCFEEKKPKNKGEELAVAAWYMEKFENKSEYTKDDLKRVITESRRNFDDKNFARDINNAKRQSGFFNLGTSRNVHKLSYKGLQFVDALPERNDVQQKTKKRKAKKSSKK